MGFFAFQILFIVLTITGVIKPMNELGENLSELANSDADLRKRITVRKDDEIGKTGTDFSTGFIRYR